MEPGHELLKALLDWVREVHSHLRLTYKSVSYSDVLPANVVLHKRLVTRGRYLILDRGLYRIAIDLGMPGDAVRKEDLKDPHGGTHEAT